MAYYRRRHYGRPFFYRRPYYYRRYKHDSGLGAKLFLIIGVLFLFSLFSTYKDNLNGLVSLILGLVVFIGFIILIAKIVQKLIKLSWRSTGSGELNVPINTGLNIDAKDASEINSEKHGCKCYMEGLTNGEQDVADLLSHELSYKDYFIFNNLIIQSENNGSTQIDHIVVSKFGIFVIESKDYKGWIFGDKDQPFWTQLLPGGKNKFQFQNPIRQNYAHVMALKNLMSIDVDNFISVVVFSDDKSEFKSAPIDNVIHLNELISYIKKYTQEKLTEEGVQLVIGKLSFACQTNDIDLAEHIKNIHEDHQI